MGKRWMSWVVVAALTFGGAGFALGGVVMGARAAGREPSGTTLVVATSPSTSSSTSSSPSHSTSPSPAPSIVPSISPSHTGELSIRRMQVTSAIDHREPVDHPSSFDENEERIYAFVDVSNPTDEARELLVTFENGQRSTGHVTLEIPAHTARFRTWAWTRLTRSPGEWTAMIHDEDGVVIASDEFEIR
jgi:hypothetical protein